MLILEWLTNKKINLHHAVSRTQPSVKTLRLYPQPVGFTVTLYAPATTTTTGHNTVSRNYNEYCDLQLNKVIYVKNVFKHVILINIMYNFRFSFIPKYIRKILSKSASRCIPHTAG